MAKTIGDFARELIVAHPDKSNQEIADMVREEFKDAKTQDNSIAWYRSQMKKDAKKAPPVKRTSKMIEDEIAMLQLELAEVKEAELKELMESKAELLAKLEMIETLEKAAQQEEETQPE